MRNKGGEGTSVPAVRLVRRFRRPQRADVVGRSALRLARCRGQAAHLPPGPRQGKELPKINDVRRGRSYYRAPVRDVFRILVFAFLLNRL